MSISVLLEENQNLRAKAAKKDAALQAMLKSGERAQYLMNVVHRFMQENAVSAECLIQFDGAECDGACLGDDCQICAEEVIHAIQLAKEAVS